MIGNGVELTQVIDKLLRKDGPMLRNAERPAKSV